MASSTYFLFQVALRPDTPEWILDAIKAMITGDVEKIMELSRSTHDKFFKQDHWERLLTQRDCQWPKEDAPPTRFYGEVDEAGELQAWHLYGASSVKRNGWDLLWEFQAMIAPWLAKTHDAIEPTVGGVMVPFVLAQDDVPFDADRPQLSLCLKMRSGAVMQHSVKDYIDSYQFDAELNHTNPYTWTIHEEKKKFVFKPSRRP